MYVEIYWLGPIDPETGLPTEEGGRYQIKNLNFAPQTDLTGNSLPVNEYTCDVITTDDIPGTLPPEAGTCTLYDERGIGYEWSYWPIKKSIRISPTCMRITCTSWISQLDYIELAETVYQGETAENVMATIFPSANDYEMANSLKSITISGYAPAQTARERLTWVLFAIGGYVRDIFASKVQILKVDTTEALIPIDRIFMRPSIDRADWVTGLKITTYSFFQAASDEAAAEYDNSYMFPMPWVATENTVTLTNPAAPEDAPPNVVEIDSIYLINPSNVSEIAARLAQYWFNPTTVQADVINNRLYRPGDLVQVYTGLGTMVSGYIQQESFAFGKQSKSTLKLVGAVDVELAKLTVNYTYQGGRIGQREYRLPVGMTYTLSNPYIDRTHEGRRYVYRPQDAEITGTMTAGDNTATQAYDLALEYRDEKLYVYSVDSATKQGSGGKYTGVIA